MSVMIVVRVRVRGVCRNVRVRIQLLGLESGFNLLVLGICGLRSGAAQVRLQSGCRSRGAYWYMHGQGAR